MVINIKKIIYITVILIILITVITLLFVKPDNKEIINLYKLYPFYKEELLNDYIDYKNKYNLSDKDTIIRVNIGLNKPFYTNVKEACYEKDKESLNLCCIVGFVAEQLRCSRHRHYFFIK